MFEKAVLLIILGFVAAAHLNLMPKAVTVEQLQPAINQIGAALQDLDKRVKVLEPVKK